MMGNSDVRLHGISTYSTRPGSQHNESQLTGFGKRSGGFTPNAGAANKGTFATNSQINKSDISADHRQTVSSRENPLNANHAYNGFPAASQSFQNSSSKLHPSHTKDRKSWASNVKKNNQEIETKYGGGVIDHEPLNHKAV